MKNINIILFFIFSMNNGSSFNNMEFLTTASRRAAAAAAVAAASSIQTTTSNSPNIHIPTPSLPPEFHPAYRIPSYIDHIYSLQHSSSSPSSVHGKYFILIL